MSALVIVVSAGILGAGFWWLEKDLAAQAEGIAATRLLEDKQAKGAALLAELKGTSAKAAEYQRKMDLLLPSEDQLFDFRPWLRGLASAHSVTLTLNYQDKGGSGAGNIESLPFSMALDGVPGNIISFIKSIEGGNQRFLIAIETFELTAGGAGARVSAQGKVFFRGKSAP